MSLKTNIQFYAQEKNIRFYGGVFDTTGKALSTYVFVQINTPALDHSGYYLNAHQSVTFDYGNIFIAFSTADYQNYYLINCFVFENGFNQHSINILWNTNTTNTNIINNINNSTTNYYVNNIQNVTSYITNPNVTLLSQCVSPNILIGTPNTESNGNIYPNICICLSSTFIPALNSYVENESIIKTTNVNWRLIVAIFIFIFVMLLIIFFMIIIFKKSQKKKMNHNK